MDYSQLWVVTISSSISYDPAMPALSKRLRLEINKISIEDGLEFYPGSGWFLLRQTRNLSSFFVANGQKNITFASKRTVDCRLLNSLLAFVFFRKEFMTSQRNVCLARRTNVPQAEPRGLGCVSTVAWLQSTTWKMPRDGFHLRDATWLRLTSPYNRKRNIGWKWSEKTAHEDKNAPRPPENYQWLSQVLRLLPKIFKCCRKSPPNITRI